ncbi:MAG: STAS domain-containing protein [Bacilli bacterium]
MLEIILEYRKGILFVRLYGELSIFTVEKLKTKVNDLIKENGMKNVVLNMENLIDIDERGINTLFYSYELCKENNGKLLICGLKDNEVKFRLNNSRIFKYLKVTNNELNAFKLLHV